MRAVSIGSRPMNLNQLTVQADIMHRPVATRFAAVEDFMIS
jgi:hypothetical protein